MSVGCGVWGVGGKVSCDSKCLESIRASGVRGSSTHDSNPHQYQDFQVSLTRTDVY